MTSSQAIRNEGWEPVMPGENPDITLEALQRLGAEWFTTGNFYLGFRAPADLIGTQDENRVRDLMRSISASALT